MSLNLIGGGYSAAAAKSTLRTVGGKSVQISISKVAFASDPIGAYTTFNTISSKTYIQKVENGAFSNCGEYLIEQEFGTTLQENIEKTINTLNKELILDYIFDTVKEYYLNNY